MNEKGNYLRHGTQPKLSDIEVTSLSLTSECLSIDIKNYLFAKLNNEYLNDFKNLNSRRQ